MTQTYVKSLNDKVSVLVTDRNLSKAVYNRIIPDRRCDAQSVSNRLALGRYPLRYGRSSWQASCEKLKVLTWIRRVMLAGRYPDVSVLAAIDDGYDKADLLSDTLVEQNIDYATQIIAAYSQVDRADNDGHLALEHIEPTAHTLATQYLSYPEWYDAELAKIGALAYRRYPLLTIWMLRNVSLMAGYAIPALTKPLLHTGQLQYQPLSRLIRTYEFILAVSNPDGMTIGGTAWQQCLRVRQLHSRVRQSVLASGWDKNYWGRPLNQSDMIATHMQFSLLIMFGYQLFGARLTLQEKKGILHLWQLASYWLGVDIVELPTQTQTSWAWLYTYINSQRLDFRAGRQLAQALHHLPTQLTDVDNKVAKLTEAVNASITRLLVGNQVSDALGLPKPRYRYLLLLVPPIVNSIDRVAEHVPAVRQRQNKLSNWRKNRIVHWMAMRSKTSELMSR